jgi:hypothetical protein
LGVYRVQGTIKEEFVANAVQAKMHIIHHAIKVVNGTVNTKLNIRL